MRHTLRDLAWIPALALAARQAASAPTVGPPGSDSSPPPFEVGIDGVYLTQSVQDYAGTVPLVQGRAGLLRVFLRHLTPGGCLGTNAGDPIV
jgi:hypothetical protein